jgi:hypothetical protein
MYNLIFNNLENRKYSYYFFTVLFILMLSTDKGVCQNSSYLVYSNDCIGIRKLFFNLSDKVEERNLDYLNSIFLTLIDKKSRLDEINIAIEAIAKFSDSNSLDETKDNFLKKVSERQAKYKEDVFNDCEVLDRIGDYIIYHQTYKDSSLIRELLTILKDSKEEYDDALAAEALIKRNNDRILLPSSIPDREIYAHVDEYPLLVNYKNDSLSNQLNLDISVNKLIKYFEENITYSENPKSRVGVKLVVGFTGNVQDIDFFYIENQRIKDEILSLINKMSSVLGKFTPGKSRGKVKLVELKIFFNLKSK